MRTRLISAMGYGAFTCSIVACSSIPPFDLLDHRTSKEPEGPAFASLVTHIQCEVWRAASSAPGMVSAEASPNSSISSSAALDLIAKYVAAVTVTADVTETNAFNPSLSFIRPFTTPNNLTLSVGGQLNGQNHRQFTYTFPIVLIDKKGQLIAWEKRKECQIPAASRLNGNLGLAEIFVGGIMSYEATDEHGTEDPQKNWIFSTTVDFTITEGLNGGPNWTVTNFKGPAGGGSGGMGSGMGAGGGASGASGSSQGLLNFNRTTKDTLLISFVPTATKSPTELTGMATNELIDTLKNDQQKRQDAYSAGQDFNTRLLLQNLLTNVSR